MIEQDLRPLRKWVCSACTRTLHGDGAPTGWATGSQNYCCAACMRTAYTGKSIAHLFPRDATDAEHAELDAHENELLAALMSRSQNAHMIGMIAGSIFKQREERQAARS